MRVNASAPLARLDAPVPHAASAPMHAGIDDVAGHVLNMAASERPKQELQLLIFELSGQWAQKTFTLTWPGHLIRFDLTTL